MPDYIGLYYPLIHFPHDSWIKLAALYWDKLGRIVPVDYPLNDSDTVQRLQGELGFIENFIPNEFDTNGVAREFDKLLDQYGDKLKRYYSLPSQESKLGYIYAKDKVAMILEKRLVGMGFAAHMTRSRGRFYQLEMHPKLVSVYMEALSVHMASTRGLQPVTHNIRDHVLMGEFTLERLAQGLLEADDGQLHLVGSSPTPLETEKLMATIALQSVLPQDIANIPIAKIIQLRQKHRTELTAFQTRIHEFTAKLDTIQQINDPRAIKAHLETAYQRELKPQLDDLKRCMKSLAIETVAGVLNVKVALPPLLASAGAALHLAPISPEVAGATAVACSVFPVFQKKRAEIRERVRTSPVAYLLYTQEGLVPTNVVAQVVRTTRQMLFGA
ncbi:MAG: hypothetical protein JO202_05695 [Ktedonobacteraceae bacterium]|nr:hypothetical protein [Ktedonobacteraceae bacterium]